MHGYGRFMGNISTKSFACSDCGQVYESPTACCCPFCRSGVVRQFPVDAEQIHARRSYAHYSKPNAYRSKIEAKNPELIPTYPDMSNSIEGYASSPVIIDWLAFTVKLADFRHCSKGGDFSGIPFPTPPILPTICARSAADVESVQNFHHSMYGEYLEQVVRIFIQRILGFAFGPLTGRVFNFYDDSFLLFSEDGEELLGRVGIGGNRDTIHFSISGAGCKHLFSNRSREFVHHWLANVLGVSLLSRIDLAADDFDGVWTCEAAEKALLDGGFSRARGRSPVMDNGDRVDFKDGKKIFLREARFFGSRQSLVYWRVYNKKLERGIDKDGFTWYRSEVELKKFTVDVLLNPVGYFVGLNSYAASILPISVEPVKAMTSLKKRVACDLISACRHAKKQYGRLVNSLLIFYKGDLQKVVSSLVRDDSSLSFPSAHQTLINSLE
ncbi:Replication initiation factor family protein [Vibrio tapetis subsp. tapetis]|uniref:Replication initiation factor family protein n=2 Tax=Vibrio tapetis TaxID=52443 RepID=A0A2N8ZLD3_9VIBR|nr:Replication initiation factor family protein [Vibrio tapetis subsp. tapetis]